MQQIRTFLFAAGLFAAAWLPAQIRLPKLVGDHMVWQREREARLWGWAGSREKLTVQFAGLSFNTRADKDGAWSVVLPPFPSGGPFDLVIQGKQQRKVVSNVLIGDVWLCGGQSNMAWTVLNTPEARNLITAATDSQIRHFKVTPAAAASPQDTLTGGEWVVATPQTVADFTAVGYYLALELRKATGVPIGLLNSSWGGSRIESWMDAQALGYLDPERLVRSLQEEDAKKVKELTDLMINKLGEMPATDLGMANGQYHWQDPNLDDSAWQEATLPGTWEQLGWEQLDGVIWYRKTIELPVQQVGKPAVLSLGIIDDSDMVWINGRQVGQTLYRNSAMRRYEIPADVLRAGGNVLAIRVEDQEGKGGLISDQKLLFLEIGGLQTPISGKWKYRVGRVDVSPTLLNAKQQPTKLYNAMIHPLLWYPIKGAIWYQGESNAGSIPEAEAYAGQFINLISRWRELWRLGDFPFLYVQLPNYRNNPPQPAPSAWASLRQSQSAALALPNTAQAVVIDVGEANDIHPRNKKDVGQRLALAARRIAYGEHGLVYSGPAHQSISQEGNKIRIRFDHVGGGLEARRDKYGYLRGFAIAGADGKFVWAKALIEGEEVVVWSDAVAEPKAVRYAWADNPDDANLYNRAGLPAGPFEGKW